MIKKIAVVFVLMFALQSNAQMILGGNFGYQIPFGAKINFYGIQLLVEKPTNEKSSLFGKVSYFFPEEISEPDKYLANAIVSEPNLPPSINLAANTQFSTIGFNFGRKNYWINPMDYGFSVYGATTINFSFNLIKSRVQSYDHTKYNILVDGNVIDPRGKGSVFNLGFGGLVGMKYDFIRFGTLFLDLSLEYNILQVATNLIAQEHYSSFGRQLNFYAGIGYRKILYFGSNNR